MVEKSSSQQRHLENLTILHGFFYHGIYYHHGQPQISKENQEKGKEKSGRAETIYSRQESQPPKK
jgi:hypothetical protein